MAHEHHHYAQNFPPDHEIRNYFMDCLVQSMNCNNVQGQKDIFNSYIKSLKKCAWKKVFERTNIGNFATTKVVNDFTKFCNEQQNLAFTKDNIQQLLESLFLSRQEIRNQCILEVFDLLTSFDEKNKIHWEGWKTNDFYKVNKKVIIPYGVDTSWLKFHNEVHINYHKADKLTDIDKCMCFLSGKKYDEIVGIMPFYHKHRSEIAFGEWYETEFFNVKFFKKGTIHLEFKDLDLLARFNQLAAKDKWNWLPGER